MRSLLAGLVEQVDRLVGQEAVADVAGPTAGPPSTSGLVGDRHLVVGLVLVAQAVQDGDRLLDARLADDDGRETALEAESFSMCSRYSSSVVAPTHCSSPAGPGMGFMRFEASIRRPRRRRRPTTL